MLQNLSMCFMKVQDESGGWWSKALFCFNTNIFCIFHFCSFARFWGVLCETRSVSCSGCVIDRDVTSGFLSVSARDFSWRSKIFAPCFPFESHGSLTMWVSELLFQTNPFTLLSKLFLSTVPWETSSKCPYQAQLRTWLFFLAFRNQTQNTFTEVHREAASPHALKFVKRALIHHWCLPGGTGQSNWSQEESTGCRFPVKDSRAGENLVLS